eukprot:TRINITY_DN5716_c0_g1_i1.p1 TRINITY_DN5716_c0_g1~~TRINITY_DN5716_c0_g1_i1.p1  ORF type:complete len:307 (+),score=92.25 TRINITY_DN5716_c0_g1_i1:98-1018(+)
MDCCVPRYAPGGEDEPPVGLVAFDFDLTVTVDDDQGWWKWAEGCAPRNPAARAKGPAVVCNADQADRLLGSPERRDALRALFTALVEDGVTLLLLTRNHSHVARAALSHHGLLVPFFSEADPFDSTLLLSARSRSTDDGDSAWSGDQEPPDRIFGRDDYMRDPKAGHLLPGKRKAAFLETWIEKYGHSSPRQLPPATALVVDDDRREVAAAQRAGFRTLLISPAKGMRLADMAQVAAACEVTAPGLPRVAPGGGEAGAAASSDGDSDGPAKPGKKKGKRKGSVSDSKRDSSAFCSFCSGDGSCSIM